MINKSKLLRDNSKTAVFCFEPGVAENTTDVDIVNGARPSFMDMHSPDIKRVNQITLMAGCVEALYWILSFFFCY
ncbi:hypothetical protein RB195_008193 [Necator americanus]|uniref:Uncharacterized protein n=1 Tax=Necator americanus TaxID=51031 RepID=A0ABR1CQ37_NECAM